jgi:hypothetical protein
MLLFAVRLFDIVNRLMINQGLCGASAPMRSQSVNT